MTSEWREIDFADADISLLGVMKITDVCLQLFPAGAVTYLLSRSCSLVEVGGAPCACSCLRFSYFEFLSCSFVISYSFSRSEKCVYTA